MIMSEQYGIFRVEDYNAKVNKKVLKIFEDLKRKAKELDRVRCDPRLSEQDDEPNFEQLNRDAIKSLHILPNVQKTDAGFEVI